VIGIMCVREFVCERGCVSELVRDRDYVCVREFV